jgi:uncharacterized Fe-S cluster protein YjdI
MAEETAGCIHQKNSQMESKTYKGDGFEVIWKPSACIHSTLCWKNLKPVFDPFRKPWIILENGEKEAIKERVLACPSGALQWSEASSPETPSSASEILHIEPRENGPLVLKGAFLLVHPDGKREVLDKTTALCRCGASANKPYCDGSHSKTGFTTS